MVNTDGDIAVSLKNEIKYSIYIEFETRGGALF